jgi:hypothetical protein
MVERVSDASEGTDAHSVLSPVRSSESSRTAAYDLRVPLELTPRFVEFAVQEDPPAKVEASLPEYPRQ